VSTPLPDDRLAAVRERQPQRAARFDCRQCWADVAVLLDEVDGLRARARADAEENGRLEKHLCDAEGAVLDHLCRVGRPIHRGCNWLEGLFELPDELARLRDEIATLRDDLARARDMESEGGPP
jgi:hypothetical protein